MVVPAKAGTQWWSVRRMLPFRHWIPAFTGMTSDHRSWSVPSWRKWS